MAHDCKIPNVTCLILFHSPESCFWSCIIGCTLRRFTGQAKREDQLGPIGWGKRYPELEWLEQWRFCFTWPAAGGIFTSDYGCFLEYSYDAARGRPLFWAGDAGLVADSAETRFLGEIRRKIGPLPVAPSPHGSTFLPQRSPFVLTVEKGTYWWCACGQSKSQPYCDGSHKGTGFSPIRSDVAEARSVAWCGCKHSKKPPFCDGSHARLD